jgi:hypothetical protein
LAVLINDSYNGFLVFGYTMRLSFHVLLLNTSPLVVRTIVSTRADKFFALEFSSPFLDRHCLLEMAPMLVIEQFRQSRSSDSSASIKVLRSQVRSTP